MKFRTLQVLTSFFICLIFLSGISNAEQKTIVKEYSYEAGEQDTKVSCRVMAMTQIKRLVLEEAGTYIAGTTVVKGLHLESDQITVMTAGIVSLKVIDESWNGKVFYMKAEATIDTDDIAKKLENVMQNQNQVAELESTKQKIDELQSEVESLKIAMSATQKQGQHAEQVEQDEPSDQNGQNVQTEQRGQSVDTADTSTQPDQVQPPQQDNINEYNSAVDQIRSLDMVQDSYVSINSGDYNNAVNSLHDAIILSAQAAPTAYIASSIAFIYLNSPQKAMAALDKAVQLSPQTEARAMMARAFVYERLGNRHEALEEVNKAIKLDRLELWAYRQRARLYSQMGNTEMAAADMRKARGLYNIRRLRHEILKDQPGTLQPVRVIKITSHPVNNLEEKPAPGRRPYNQPGPEEARQERGRLQRERAEKNRFVKTEQRAGSRQQERQLRIEAARQQQQKRLMEKKRERLGMKQARAEKQRQRRDSRPRPAAKGPIK